MLQGSGYILEPLMMMIMMIVIIIIVNDRVFWCVRVHYSFSKGILSNCPLQFSKNLLRVVLLLT